MLLDLWSNFVVAVSVFSIVVVVVVATDVDYSTHVVKSCCLSVGLPPSTGDHKREYNS